MGKIIFYLRDAQSLDNINEAIKLKHSNDVSVMIVLHLTELSKDVIPLIGDLKEIRREKYKRLIDKWLDESFQPKNEFYSIVMQGELDKSLIEKQLSKDSENTIYIFSEYDRKVEKIFVDIKKKFPLKIIECFNPSSDQDMINSEVSE